MRVNSASFSASKASPPVSLASIASSSPRVTGLSAPKSELLTGAISPRSSDHCTASRYQLSGASWPASAGQTRERDRNNARNTERSLLEIFMFYLHLSR